MNRLRVLLPSVKRSLQQVRFNAAEADGQKTSLVRPSKMQRQYLLWSKMYKTPEEIPEEVSFSKLKRATDWARIRINILLTVALLMGCITAVYAGKKEHGWGNSAQLENRIWHEKMNAEAKEAK